VRRQQCRILLGVVSVNDLVGSFSQSEWIRPRVDQPKRTPFLPPDPFDFAEAHDWRVDAAQLHASRDRFRERWTPLP
jgi:hypothetical protein